MTYPIFSDHAPTGQTAIKHVSSNPYSIDGRTIGYPNNFDVYVQHLSDADGSQSVTETREVTDLIGSRLYLFHRPMVNSDGTASAVAVSDGVLDESFTNASQGYIVFSSLPSAQFTVSYVAVPDCDLSWSVNNLQNSVMEIQGQLGPDVDTTYPGIKNLKIATFNNPTGFTASGVLNNGVHLPHLDQDVTIASSDDPTLQLLRGTGYTIQLGRQADNVVVDATGFTIMQSDGSKVSDIFLGGKTGDAIWWKGVASGAGPLSLGGPEWPTYSGVAFAGDLSGAYYTGSMLRVHGDASFMGDVKAIGNITIINSTGSTSTVIGDWTIRDELFVEGISHLQGPTIASMVTVQENLYLDKDLIANNQAGQGGQGQTLLDGLDASEIAWTYNTAIKARHANSVITAPISPTYTDPKNVTYRPWMELGPENLVGDVFAITGQLNASASNSGAHPHILQLLMDVTMVSGTYSEYGYTSGFWSPGMMQPGSMRVKMLDGQAQGFSSPIYGYTVEETGTVNSLTRLNVFLPEAITNPPQTNDAYLLYNPGSIRYNTITAMGGGSPTFSINASTTEPFAVSFEDDVRVMKTNSSTYSLTAALIDSVSGKGGSPVTGIAYIYADSNNTDPENPPIFKARATPIRMDGQTSVGEVVASLDAGTWTLLDTVSYRPNGQYDSAWIPIFNNETISDVSGRCVPGFTSDSTDYLQIYFHHDLGTDLDIGNISANLFLGSLWSGTPEWNQTHSPMYSFFGQDSRNSYSDISGSFTHVSLGAKSVPNAIGDAEASIFFLDSSLIGIDISPGLLAADLQNYLRLSVNKNN
tara:strand:+ start:103182 stop:105614 length:2433 start_codon:yes stop_codon:yes gene_type:complete